jgi:hypothetical protein
MVAANGGITTNSQELRVSQANRPNLRCRFACRVPAHAQASSDPEYLMTQAFDRSRQPARAADPAGLPPPSTQDMLCEGGDARLMLDPVSGRNRYGCTPHPADGAAHFGSATASTISPAAFAAADDLRRRLAQAGSRELAATTYASELDRVRTDLIGLCGLHDLAGLDVVFAASGTDLHLLAAELFASPASAPTLCIDVEPEETGSGVPAALAGRHFSPCAALGSPVTEGAPVGAVAAGSEFVAVAARASDGGLRAPAEVEADLDALCHAAARAGRRVLLAVSDVSKTGLISPGLDVVLALRRRFPGCIEVLVDACQFRLSPATMRAYLDQGFLVAVTGSKFLAGPTFSGALLVPASASEHLRGRLLRPGLQAYSARADWPGDWVAGAGLTDVANFGLLLRWEAALTELRAFRAIPEADVETFVARFAGAVEARLTDDPAFKPLAGRDLDRSAIGAAGGWDQQPTIFPFLLRHMDGPHTGYLSLAANQDVYRSLMSASTPVRLGQPVLCGQRQGRPISALRLCNSARLIVEGAANGSARTQAVIDRAMAALDQAVAAARAVSRTGRL